MARLAIRNRDRTGQNPVHLWRRGDVVEIREDGDRSFTGRLETPENGFAILEVPGVPASRLEHLLQVESDSIKSTDYNGRRLRALDLDSLAADPLNTFNGERGRATEEQVTLYTRTRLLRVL